MSLDFSKLSAEELLAAESAVLVMRSVNAAVKSAPHGQGLFQVEAMLHEKGFDHLRQMLELSLASQEGAQKKGPAECHSLKGQSRRTQQQSWTNKATFPSRFHVK